MKKIALLASLISATLIGCGGGGGGSSESSNSAFSGDGIYVNDTDLAVMVIDSKRAHNNVIVGDFTGNSVYFVDTATTSSGTVNASGIAYVTNNGPLQTDTAQTITATLNNNAVTLTATVGGTNLAYSMDKTSDSLPLAEIVGTHTSPDDGSTWQIDADGSLTVNGFCTISGNLVRNGAYFNITGATAVGCSPSSYNGSYDGVLLTVEHNGQNHIAAVLGSNSGILWGSAPKN